MAHSARNAHTAMAPLGRSILDGTVLLVDAVTEDHWATEGTYPGMRLFFEGGTAAGTSCACVTPGLPQIVCAGSA